MADLVVDSGFDGKRQSAGSQAGICGGLLALVLTQDRPFEFLVRSPNKLAPGGMACQLLDDYVQITISTNLMQSVNYSSGLPD